MVSYIKVSTRLRVFENRILRKTLKLRRKEVTRNWKNYIISIVIISVPRHVLLHR